MDYQQPHGYMRYPPPPPPPSAPDPFQRPPPPPSPSNHPWPYSATQFHYQPQTQHVPSPPPPQWPQPPHTSDHAQYPSPPPYQPHQPPHYHAPLHYPHPPRPPHVSHPHSQDWGNGNWNHHQNWQYPTEVNNNEEDWAARAKAWATAKSASDNQPSLSQFVAAGRPEEQIHFHEQYPQSMNPQYPDGHTPLAPTSNYHQFPVAMGPPNSQLQDCQYMSSGQSSYGADGRAPFAARDGGVAGDSNQSFQPLEKSTISPLVHQQEVPTSYSSVAGIMEAGNRYERLNSSLSTPVTSLPPHQFQHVPPPTARSGWVMEPYPVLSSQPAESVTDMSDQPLNFAPHFNRDTDTHIHSNNAHSSSLSVGGGDTTVAMSSNYAWPPHTAAPGAAYPQAPPTIPFGSQVDHMPSPASGHTAPIFPPGPGFQPAVAMAGPAFGIGAGGTPHPTILGDVFGSAERPKKASVPNWLREEIIKNKAVIISSSSAPNLPKEDLQSMEEENDRFSRKGDQSDSKSIDSSGSTEDEDEDEVETARTAAINQEIKRVLTEVLLKVTDELFDEISTKVLKEDDLSVQVDQVSDLSNHHIFPSAPSISTPKASAKILIPSKAEENDNEDASEKSTSGLPGDILGLASYASDEEDEMQSPGKPSSKESFVQHHLSSSRLLEGDSVIENSSSRVETEDQRNVPAKLDSSSIGRKSSASVANLESTDNMASKDLSNSLAEKAVERNETPDGKRWMNRDSLIKVTRNGSHKNDDLESRKSSMKKEHKGLDSSKGGLGIEGYEDHNKHEERHARTDRNDWNDNSKDRVKEKGKTDEKGKNTESRKRISPSDDKEGVVETHRDKRSSKKDSGEKRKERTGDERKERSRHKSGAESSRHKRHRSSSVDFRDRESKDNRVASRANDSTDESSDDSRSKSRHSRRHISPLSTRTKKRQVSRSPHSKHSKRRHSPYSSLESTRGKRSPSRSRSRSISPGHRRR